MANLQTETNTPSVEKRIRATARVLLHKAPRRLQTDFEHGQWWVTCLDCGAQWSVVDSGPGFDFERVTEGDGYCNSH